MDSVFCCIRCPDYLISFLDPAAVEVRRLDLKVEFWLLDVFGVNTW